MHFKNTPVCLLLALLNIGMTFSHLVLNYPSPRKFDLDFLENSTSTEPCGMVKGVGKTTIQSGRPFNVSWKIPYPARVGGYRLQLLDSLSRPLLDLTPVTSDSLFVVLDSGTENLTITIPNDYECENCTIRLVRESQEWPEKRWFWSCADVDIKSKKAFRENCNGHGRYLLSKCRCDRFFYGESCQFKDECTDNSDCGETGRCVDLATTTPPRKQCYCETGWFGFNCAKRSQIRSEKYDLSGHMHKELSEGFHLYWRMRSEEGEIELAIIANTTNYVAVGWRPNDTSTDCRKFPKTENADNTTVPEMTDGESEIPLHPMECTDMVIGMARGTAVRIWDYYSKDQSTPKVDTYWGGKNDLTSAFGFEKDGVTTVIFRKKLNAVDSTDHSIVDEEMHVIWAKGQDKKKVSHWFDNSTENKTVDMDFYRDDELKYHGFTGNRGYTTINFFGDQSGNNEGNQNENGTQSTQQLVTQACMGEWRHPEGCSIAGDDCEYYAQWLYLPEKDSIRFTISTTNTNLWTGIGFSNDLKMAQTDAIIALIDQTGRAFLMDTWIVGRTSPFLDSIQDVTNVSAKLGDKRNTMTFERKRSTGDSRDLAFTDDECLYMMFPTKGGKYDARSKKISQHQVTPKISSTRVCIRACPSAGGAFGTSLVSNYNLQVKLAKFGKEFQVPKEGTPEYESLSGSITGAFKKLLSRFQKSLTIDLKGFTKEEEHIITSIELHSENRNLDAAIKKTIENAVVKGQVGTIYLEPGYWHYEPIQDPNQKGGDSDELHKRILTTILESWIVIGCLIALLVLVVIQAWCTLCCRSSKKSDQKDMMYPNMAWKDYSGPGLNYGIDNVDSNEKHPPESMKSMSGPMYQPNQQKTPYTLQHVPKVTKHPNNNIEAKSLQRPMKGHMMPHDPSMRSTQTLPRAPPQGDFEGANYYTHRPTKPQKNDKGQVQPDFYFMPSQRKYSGEVVRVYVDYDNQSK